MLARPARLCQDEASRRSVQRDAEEGVMADSNPPVRSMNAAADMLQIVVRNMQALTTAQQQVLDGIGLLARQQTQMAQALLRYATPGAIKLPATDPAASIDWLKSEMETTQAATNELSQLILNISGNAATTLQTRTYAALDELKAVAVAMQPASKAPAVPPSPPVKLPAPAAKTAAAA
jgi:hypothetical protein